ncbi:hypothetical protein JCM19274_2677 [Algibacter lectus]|uniref:DNA primase n=1 Tax=Algibacter lectus TaxID=221126 RepID=A0A090WSE7_9FLAO|nr:DUF6371 domain-containing protein [Algibacter lectus]GAL80005.1 hypothetical protein JCM19274_2677 [Algibacter lectus]
MNYKYTLDKSSKKHQCPSCGKKTLVRYINVETNSYINDNSGRCDRESKCQYHKSPKGNEPLVNCNTSFVQQLPSSHNELILGVYGRNYTNNNFISYLLKYFVPVDVKHAIKKYFIGTSNHWYGSTIFWQVDEQMNICAGKVMLYDKITGKRVKRPYPHINWMHKVLKTPNFVLQQCLFGLHNLCDYDNSNTICIVESEKTAIIMSILFPHCLWLATGSKANLKEELLKPIKDYNIVVFPDKTEFRDWNTKVKALEKEGFLISCSNLLENRDLEDGSDLVDVFLTSL